MRWSETTGAADLPAASLACEERGVTWGEVDLRWGILRNSPNAAGACLSGRNQTLPAVLHRATGRAVWLDSSIPAEVLKNEPWVREHAEGDGKKSVTELEILHGVLNDPAMADHAFFYFRDPKFVDSVPKDNRTDFNSEDSECRTKLQQLKGRIRQEHRAGKLKYEPREDYENAKDLGARVLADFTALIDTLYPEGEQSSPLERERMDHEAVARSRAKVYIGRQEYFDRLDSHVAGDGSPLLVLGESGCGKSALLSNWALRYRARASRRLPAAAFHRRLCRTVPVPPGCSVASCWN
jgi:nephrocystin-3